MYIWVPDFFGCVGVIAVVVGFAASFGLPWYLLVCIGGIAAVALAAYVGRAFR